MYQQRITWQLKRIKSLPQICYISNLDRFIGQNSQFEISGGKDTGINLQLGAKTQFLVNREKCFLIIPYAEKTLGRFYLTWGITKTYLSLRRLYKLEEKNFDILSGKLYEILLHVGNIIYPWVCIGGCQIYAVTLGVYQRIPDILYIPGCVSEDARFML